MTAPSASKLYVRSGTGTTIVTNPNLGINNGQFSSGIYNSLCLPTLSIGGSVADCANYEPSGIIIKPTAQDLFISIATNMFDSSMSPQQKWISQFGVWQSALADSTFADSSAELSMFQTLAAASRYAYITAIEDSIANEQFGGAMTLIMDSALYTAPSSWAYDTTTGAVVIDDVDADKIISNYLTLYTLYINYRTYDTISTADSAFLYTLANACPLYDGMVVYQARTLYNRLFDTLIVFADNTLCGIVDTGAKHGNNSSNAAYNNWLNTQKVNSQQYMLSPNPNNGNLTIAQKETDGDPVYAEVWNAVGQTTYKGVMLFNGNTTQLRLEGIQPGLYVMLLTDSRGRNYTLKFIVNK
jgi:Secretion system C-terminal sorting domain